MTSPSFAPTPGKVPTQSQSTLSSLYAKWAARRQAAVSQGFHPAPIDAIYRQDWAKVAAGGTPMTLEEAQASVNAAYSGKGPVTKGRPSGILGTLENIVPDVGSVLWNFPKGLVDLVHHLPSEAETTAKLFAADPTAQAKAGWEPRSPGEGLLSALAKGVRNISRVPLAALIPGAHTAGELTTSAGRKTLQQHPVGTALDVLPFAGGAARVGALGAAAEDVARAGSVAEEADRLVAGGRVDLANQLATAHGFTDYPDLVAGTSRTARAAEALTAGRPLKALVRAVPALDEARLSLLDRFNATPLAKGYRRAKTMGESITSRKLEAYTQNDLKPMVAGLKTPGDVARIHQLATHATDWPTAEPADQAVLDRLRANQDARAATDIAQAKLLPFQVEGRQVVYAGEQANLLATLQGRLDRSIARAHRAEDNLYTARQTHPDDSPEVTRAVSRANDAHALHDRRDRLMARTLSRTVPAAYAPLVEDQVRQKVMAHLSGSLGADTAPFREAMAAYDRGKPLGAYLPEKSLAKYTMEARAGWQALVKDYNPIWVPSMSADDLERALHPIRFRDKPPSVSAWKSRYVNQSAGSANFALALGLAEAERLRYADNLALTDTFVRPVARTTSEIDRELEGPYNRLRSSEPSTTPDAQVQNMARSRAYTRLDSSLGLGGTPAMKKLYSEDLWVPKDLADAIAKSMQSPHPNELQKLNMSTIRLFKFTVMGLSPTHQAHIWLGSMLPLMLRGGKEELNPGRIIDAWHLARHMTTEDLTKPLPEAVSRHVSLLNRSQDVTNAEDLMDYAHGLTMGRLVGKAVGALEFSRKMSDLGINMYRSIAYLSEEARGLRSGMGEELAAAHAVAYANKVFVDIGGMTPIESYVAKNLFPFYSYTRWALQYLMQYPVDHPIRASVLARLGEHEASYNQQKGIANTMAMLFHLGKPNSSGDQWGVQLRAFNPFRSTATTFTMAGVFGGLNPIARTFATAAGVSTLSGTPDPFPGLDIDPNTGGLVGTVKGQSPLAAAEQVVPPVALLDHYLGLSQQARSLRSSDPVAFRRQVFSILNMPFVPQAYTPYLTEASHARDQLRVAQNAVSAAMKSQDLSSLSIYDNVPVPAKVRTYLGGRTFADFPTFEKTVEAIWAWEKQTGQKVI